MRGCLINGAYKTKEHIGKTLAQLAEEQGKTPFDACIDLLAANDGIVQGIYFFPERQRPLKLHEQAVGDVRQRLERLRSGGGS